MPPRRLLALLAGFAFSLGICGLEPSLGGQGLPTSVALLYFKQKNFREGDWVFYRVQGSNITGSESVDYQRVQIGPQVEYRGESCFWLETGWGQAPDKLAYSAVLVSEEIYREEVPEVRFNSYMRRLHVGYNADGDPVAIDVRPGRTKVPLAEIAQFIPKVRVIGTDTLQTPKGPIPCEVWEVESEYTRIRDLPDSTMREITQERTKRWMNPSIPITGLLKEEEHKVFYVQKWPLGKPSTDFPKRVFEMYDKRIQLLDFGSGAKPVLSDRMKTASGREYLDQP